MQGAAILGCRPFSRPGQPPRESSLLILKLTFTASVGFLGMLHVCW